MHDSSHLVKGFVEPPLFPLEACALKLEALVDRSTETVVFVVASIDPVNLALNALWSSSPIPFEHADAGYRKASSEFYDLLYGATGPFA